MKGCVRKALLSPWGQNKEEENIYIKGTQQIFIMKLTSLAVSSLHAENVQTRNLPARKGNRNIVCTVTYNVPSMDGNTRG